MFIDLVTCVVFQVLLQMIPVNGIFMTVIPCTALCPLATRVGTEPQRMLSALQIVGKRLVRLHAKM